VAFIERCSAAWLPCRAVRPGPQRRHATRGPCYPVTLARSFLSTWRSSAVERHVPMIEQCRFVLNSQILARRVGPAAGCGSPRTTSAGGIEEISIDRGGNPCTAEVFIITGNAVGLIVRDPSLLHTLVLFSAQQRCDRASLVANALSEPQRASIHWAGLHMRHTPPAASYTFRYSDTDLRTTYCQEAIPIGHAVRLRSRDRQGVFYNRTRTRAFTAAEIMPEGTWIDRSRLLRYATAGIAW
jgi:hypothetical protein